MTTSTAAHARARITTLTAGYGIMAYRRHLGDRPGCPRSRRG